MSGPVPYASTTWRMLLAFAVFVGMVGGGVAWLVRRGNLAGSARLQPAPAPALERGAPEVFYESIGHAPADFHPIDRSAKLSFTLELDLTERREEAERLIDSLQERGIDAYYTPLSRGGKVVYRVRHGIYPTRDQAQAAQLALKDQRKVATKIVKLQ